MIAKHANHVCYCDRVDGAMVATERAVESSFEFYVSDDGSVLMRRSVGSAGEREVVCLTGCWNIEEFCANKRCRVPDATARLLQDRRAVAQTGGLASAIQKGSSMKTENGKTVTQVWEELFVENESRKQKWTDEQLSEELKRRVPKLKTADPRPAMYRGFYNQGTYSFKALGTAASRGLPESFKYDEQGNKVLPGKRRAIVESETGDPNLVPISRVVKENKTKAAAKPIAKAAAKATAKAAVKKKVVRSKSK